MIAATLAVDAALSTHRSSERSTRTRWILAFAALLACTVPVASTGACAHSKDSAELLIEVPSADRDAEVYVDGNYMGLVEALDGETTGTILLAPGVHRVEVRKPGRFPVQRTVTVDRRPQARIVVEAELLEDPQ